LASEIHVVWGCVGKRLAEHLAAAVK